MQYLIQLPLNGIDIIPSSRPSINDDEILELVCKKLAKKVYKWCNYRTPIEQNEKAFKEITEDLLDTVAYYKDGYEIARSLENGHGYTPDGELVSILDNIAFIFHDVHSKVTFEWVRKYDIKNKHSLGDNVNVIYKEKSYAGYIRRINKKRAQYTITIPELGHITKNGNRATVCGTIGICYNFEDIDNI